MTTQRVMLLVTLLVCFVASAAGLSCNQAVSAAVMRLVDVGHFTFDEAALREQLAGCSRATVPARFQYRLLLRQGIVARSSNSLTVDDGWLSLVQVPYAAGKLIVSIFQNKEHSSATKLSLDLASTARRGSSARVRLGQQVLELLIASLNEPIRGFSARPDESPSDGCATDSVCLQCTNTRSFDNDQVFCSDYSNVYRCGATDFPCPDESRACRAEEQDARNQCRRLNNERRCVVNQTYSRCYLGFLLLERLCLAQDSQCDVVPPDQCSFPERIKQSARANRIYNRCLAKVSQNCDECCTDSSFATVCPVQENFNSLRSTKVWIKKVQDDLAL